MSHAAVRTALITGASSGMGAEFAGQLAAAGTNLILVARRLDRLEELARGLREKHAVAVECLQADLTSSEGIALVERRAAGDETIDLLVNNAGFTNGKPFIAGDAIAHMGMVQVHVATTIRLSRAVLPGMIARRRGAIINVASLAAWSPFSGPMYSGTKAFLVMFSGNLQSELQGTGVRVQALCPGMTRTEFHEAGGVDNAVVPQRLWMTAEKVVRTSLRRLGRGSVCVPGWRNRAIAFLMRCPVTAAAARAFSRLPAVRKRSQR
jgi:hypothetical protein